jgi:hypothetical protein
MRAAPLGWALLIGVTEAAWRWRVRSRAGAWQLTALSLLAASLWPSPPSGPGRARTPEWMPWLGLTLSVAGYPVGRMIAGDRAAMAPRDTLGADLLALSLLAIAEERTWAVHVEPVLGPISTAILFAVKHPLLDNRWRRALGLALFWTGLSVVRQKSKRGALWLHVAANVSGVLLGHARQRDQF